ncbi:MAG: class F sortase [Dehalococcoidia bacterium]|nr:class F sortase [Dehalococcoidia bacterium]
MRRRLLLVLGGLTLAAGLGLLSVGLLSIIDTGSKAEPVLVDLGSEQGRDFAFGISSPTATAEPTPPPGPPLGDAPYQFVIDSIGVNAPVRTYGLDPATLDTTPTPEVPTGPDAAEVVAWYDFSAKPGTGGNAVFAGHVTWFGAAVFYALDQVKPGDGIRLIGQDGTEVAYTVSSVFEIDPNDPDAVTALRPTDKPVITIITCGGTFVNTGDPVFGGEYSNRLIVRGDLVSVKPPAAAAASVGG